MQQRPGPPSRAGSRPARPACRLGASAEHVASRPGGRPLQRFAQRCALLLLVGLVGCATRAPHPDPATKAQHAGVPERTVAHLLSTWKDRLGTYIERDGAGDPAILSHTRTLQPRDVQRPGRIMFGVLDVDSGVPGRDGWDVQGVLIGKQASGGHPWYVFLVGLIQRSDYRPMGIQDIRLVALSAQAGVLRWRHSAAQPQAVARYLTTFAASDPLRFPDDGDRLQLTASGDRVEVQESESGAEWFLQLGDAGSDKRERVALLLSPG